MYLSRSTRLSCDKPARLLFMAPWVAPIGLPMMAAAASPWIADRPPEWTAQMLLRVEQPQREPTRAETRADLIRASKTRAVGRMPRGIIPGSPDILAARFEAGGMERNTAIGHTVRRVLGTHVLRDVQVTANLRLSASGVIVALAGVAPMGSGAECRRLDGVVEPCTTRAMSRLEILTRGRPVTCEFRADQASDEMQGVCRAGKINIADDLVRNGLARRLGST